MQHTATTTLKRTPLLQEHQWRLKNKQHRPGNRIPQGSQQGLPCLAALDVCAIMQGLVVPWQ